MPGNASLEQTLAALQQLLNMFRPERYLYLFGAVVGLLFSIYYTYYLIDKGDLVNAQGAVLLGSSGVIATASFRISFMFNKSFDLISRLVAGQAEPIAPAAAPPPADEAGGLQPDGGPST